MTIDNDGKKLEISMAPDSGQVPLNGCNSENTIILENIPPCDTPVLEMYIENETECGQVHLIQTEDPESPSSALLTGLQGM